MRSSVQILNISARPAWHFRIPVLRYCCMLMAYYCNILVLVLGSTQSMMHGASMVLLQTPAELSTPLIQHAVLESPAAAPDE